MKLKIISLCAAMFLLYCCMLNSLFAQDLVFHSTGSDQTWVVPAGVTKITVKLWGAGGAGGHSGYNNMGGGGGFVTGTLNVTPGEVLTIMVGEGGKPGAGPGAYGGGGGKDCGYGGRGGGRSAIINSLGSELITAGAGGGGGGVAFRSQLGGNGGGGLTGQASAWEPEGGGPGTQTTGGSGGTVPGYDLADGLPGTLHSGGSAPCYNNGNNGSGGGGYYGGGSGTDAGDGAGGGGSSFVPPGGRTKCAHDEAAANHDDPDYVKDHTLAGYGGAAYQPGYPGLVIIKDQGTGTSSASMTFRAHIDGSDYVHVKGNEVWYVHRGFQLPGKYNGENRPTHINRKDWYPLWPNETSSRYQFLKPPLASAGISNVKVVKLNGRGIVDLVQVPDASNDYEAIILLDDDPQAGPDCYKFVLTWDQPIETSKVLPPKSSNRSVADANGTKNSFVASRIIASTAPKTTVIKPYLNQKINLYPDSYPDQKASLYPNPSNGTTSLKFNISSAGGVIIKVYDMTGRVVFNKPVRAQKNNNTCLLNLSHLSSGNYYLELNDGSTSQLIQFVIHK